MLASAAEAAMDKTWTMEELMDKGQGALQHQVRLLPSGQRQGPAPAFPGLAGSPIATGSHPGHMDIVLNGKPGTAMVAWNTLNDLELAAIITYERNAWGNDTGDLVQPSDIKAARSLVLK
jgi:cytochrome c oxidase subunit II